MKETKQTDTLAEAPKRPPQQKVAGPTDPKNPGKSTASITPPIIVAPSLARAQSHSLISGKDQAICGGSVALLEEDDGSDYAAKEMISAS